MATFSFTHLNTDWALSQIGDLDAMHGMLAMLQDALQRDIGLIEQLLESGELVAANRTLHALKGFVPIFCQDGLCTQVVEVEVLSKVGPIHNVALAYAVLRPELQNLLDDVRTYLAHVGNTGHVPS
jgi:hypothetical protein